MIRTQSDPPPERIDPTSEKTGTVSHHLVKYDFARRLGVTGHFLDVGCGFGYGSAFLSGPERLVISIDVAFAVTTVAQRRYGEAAAFVTSDAEALSFRSKIFDCVVCFEAIEHFVSPERHLEAITRVLRESGTYIVSTPAAGTGGDPARNPHHLREFDEESFERLLRAYFRRVEILGQRRIRPAAQNVAIRFDILGLRRLGSLKFLGRALVRLVGGRIVDDATLSDFEIGAVTSQTTEFIAVCREPI